MKPPIRAATVAILAGAFCVSAATPNGGVEPMALPVGGAVESVSWSPGSHKLAVHVKPAPRPGVAKAAAGGGRSIQVWDVAGRRLVRGVPVAPQTSVAGMFSPDGRSLACGVWREANPVQRLLAKVPDRRHTEIWVWDAETGERTATLTAAPLEGLALPFTSDVVSLAYSPDGSLLAAGTKLVSDGELTGLHIGGEVCLWDARAARLKWNARAVHTDVVYAVAFSPDGRTLATGGRDKLVRLWDPQTGEVKGTLFGAGWDGIASLAFSPDGSHLASGGDASDAAEEGGRVRVWDVASGRLAWTRGDFHPGSTVRVAYGRDGTLYAAGRARGGAEPSWQVRAWDRPATGGDSRPVADRPGFARAIAPAPDGRSLAVGTWEGQVVIVALHD